jgi:tetratricopeptide (TPR) repeat protein
MRWVGLLLLLGLVACAPPGSAERNLAACVQAVAPQQRVPACSAVIGDADAPVASRVQALIARGGLRMENSQYARAIADYGRALRLDPNSAEALARRGQAHQERGAFDAAERDFAAALALQPDLQIAAQGRGAAAAGAASTFQNEIARLDAAIAAAPGDALLRNNRCWVRAINGQDLEAALADCDASLRIDPRNAAVRDSRGLVNYKLGRYSAALADYDAALAMEPGVAHYMFGRGLSLIAMGQELDGRAAIQQAVTQDERVRGMYLSYGVTAP